MSTYKINGKECLPQRINPVLVVKMRFNCNYFIKIDNKDVAFIGGGWYNDDTLNTQMSVIFAQMSSQSTGLDKAFRNCSPLPATKPHSFLLYFCPWNLSPSVMPFVLLIYLICFPQLECKLCEWGM